MSKKKPQTDLPESNLSHIAEALRPLAVEITSLVADPANARLHPEKNLQAIQASLRVYGQRKPVVVNRRTGVVESGNGTLQAARALGWTHLAAVQVDDDPATAVGFAIADNRSGELAEWDTQVLRQLRETVDHPDPDLQAMLDELEEELIPEPEPATAPVLGDTATTAATPFLKFGEAEVPMSNEELERLQAAFQRFTSEFGTSFGFVSWMLNHVQPGV